MANLTYAELRKKLIDFNSISAERNNVIIKFDSGRVLYSYESPAAVILYNPDGSYIQYVISGIWDYSKTTTKDVVKFFNYLDSKELNKAIENKEITEILLRDDFA